MSFVDRLMLASLLFGVALGAGACALFALRPIFKRIKAMDAKIEALKTAVETYISDAEKVIADGKAAVQAAVDKAVADDRAGRDVDVDALNAEVKAAHDRMVPPVFDPSANRS